MPLSPALMSRSPRRSVVTHGTFDGVHLGHAALVAETVAQARRLGARAVVLTYDPHPREVLRGEAVPRLSEREARVAHLDALGADEVIVVPFTRELAAMDAGAFVRDVLVGTYGAVHVVVGHDHGYGVRRGGTVETLRADGDALGFGVSVVGPVVVGGAPVSSSRIRAAVAAGDVEAAARLLGRPFALDGVVVEGDRIGRTLGFPTANVVPGDARVAIPADGVYTARVVVAAPGAGAPADAMPGGRYDALVSIGTRPTFDGADRRVEAWLYDADGDLYGRILRIEFDARLRGTERFDTVDALVARMREDAVLGAARLGRVS